MIAEDLLVRCDALVRRGLSRPLATDLKTAGDPELVAALERASDDQIATLNKAYVARTAAEIAAALQAGKGIVCPLRCWSCLTLQCPGGPHDWADHADIEHAAKTGQPDPTGQSCGCHCVDGPSLGPEETDMDEVSLDVDPCPVCRSAGACATDAEGRPMIHTLTDEEDQ